MLMWLEGVALASLFLVLAIAVDPNGWRAPGGICDGSPVRVSRVAYALWVAVPTAVAVVIVVWGLVQLK